jgi:NTE family protein
MPGGDRPVSGPTGKIALALSGGGSRAMAFHLGCLRALHAAGILDRISTISSVSGGSVIAALYCQTPGDFDAFESRTRGILARGLVRPAAWAAISTLEGLKALVNVTAIALDRALASAARLVLRFLWLHRRVRAGWLRQSPIRRGASRTTILRRVFSRIFDHEPLTAFRRDRPKLIIVACELRTKSAFYFASDKVGSWQLGAAASDGIEIAHAVTASAAYPLFLPALDEIMTFTKGGATARQRVILTDGGVYDNLGLAPLWPGRDSSISLHVDDYSRIIACRAGYSLQSAPAPAFAPSRMTAVFESVHARAQNLATNRLFDLERAGEIEAILFPYLGQKDSLLSSPPADFVRGQDVADYPTDFSAMPEEWIDKLVKRGEQITTALLAQYWAGFPNETGTSGDVHGKADSAPGPHGDA